MVESGLDEGQFMCVWCVGRTPVQLVLALALVDAISPWINSEIKFCISMEFCFLLLASLFLCPSLSFPTRLIGQDSHVLHSPTETPSWILVIV